MERRPPVNTKAIKTADMQVIYAIWHQANLRYIVSSHNFKDLFKSFLMSMG